MDGTGKESSKHEADAGLALTPGIAEAFSQWKPQIGLLVWISLLPVQLDTIISLGFRFAPADIVLAGLVAGILGKKLLRTGVGLRYDSVLVWAALLLLWLVSGLPVTSRALGHLPAYVVVNKIAGLVLLIAVYWTTLNSWNSAQDARRALAWYCWAGSVWNLVGLVAYALQTWGGVVNPLVYGEGRLCGFLVDPNAYGGFLVSVLVPVVAQCVLTTRSRAMLVVNAGVLFYGVLLTSSRSAWLALAAGLGALFLILRGRERIRLAIVMAVFAVVLVLHVFVLSPASRGLATRGVQIETRKMLMEEAVASALRAPLRGIGLGVFQTLPGSRGYIVHTTYLWLLAETGFVGLALLLIMLGFVFWQYRKSLERGGALTRPVALGVISAMAAWLGLMVGIEALYQRHFWFLAGVLGVLYLRTRRNEEGTGAAECDEKSH